MAKFKVCVQQYVEETAVLEIDAETPEDAVAIGRQMLSDGDIDNWGDGDDTMHQDVYVVLDANRDIVWER
jgi:hypothetical protein